MTWLPISSAPKDVWLQVSMRDVDRDPPEWRAIRQHLNGQIVERIFVQDGSDYRAALLTRADFYCADFIPAKP